ncbi:hypothetical protein BDQ17DRAFT_1330652 [Cyathus striatus]|nr:hypothetical protein BDQ17DRAFT_1330652 [Cyathus striatus]
MCDLYEGGIIVLQNHYLSQIVIQFLMKSTLNDFKRQLTEERDKSVQDRRRLDELERCTKNIVNALHLKVEHFSLHNDLSAVVEYNSTSLEHLDWMKRKIVEEHCHTCLMDKIRQNLAQFPIGKPESIAVPAQNEQSSRDPIDEQESHNLSEHIPPGWSDEPGGIGSDAGEFTQIGPLDSRLAMYIKHISATQDVEMQAGSSALSGVINSNTPMSDTDEQSDGDG